jgi:hypothetical protein
LVSKWNGILYLGEIGGAIHSNSYKYMYNSNPVLPKETSKKSSKYLYKNRR